VESESPYMGRFVNDSVAIDSLLESVLERATYRESDMRAAVEAWLEADGENIFWHDHLGPAVDALERTLGLYGLEAEPTCDICGRHMEDSPNIWRDSDGRMIETDWNGETGNHKTCERST
jgi:hypothetical protein